MSDFAIYDLPAGGGTLALSPVPGRGSYQNDVAAISRWGADMVLTMTMAATLRRWGADGLGDDLGHLGIEWRHLPTEDFGIPAPSTDALWPAAEADALALLGKGGKVLAHCTAGCGRSGMAVLRLMIAAGEPPETALLRLRQVRACAVETKEQMIWAGLNP